ncbi:MAG TPA: LysR family transcriptional regulator [Kineosporiaceae bacterium]|nr:LysR family transcriptional regulator [Kineosporiaceae bacterium]
MIDLVALRSLLALDSYGTVSAAASATGYTPSAVSQQIKRMERDLGVDLLDRVGRGVVLTEQGRLLVQHGHGIVRHLEAAMSGLQSEDAGARGAIRIVAFSTAVRGLVAPLFADLVTNSPEVIPELVERDPPEAVEMLSAGQTDLAIVHNWVGVPLHRPPYLGSCMLGQDVADLLVHRDHRLASAGSVTPADLLTEPWASTPVGSICHGWFSYMFAGFAAPPRVRFWSWEFASQIQLVAEGVAVALVPRLGRGPLPDGVVAVSLTDPVPTRMIEVLWRESMSASPTLRHVRERLQALFAPGEPAGQVQKSPPPKSPKSPPPKSPKSLPPS